LDSENLEIGKYVRWKNGSCVKKDFKPHGTSGTFFDKKVGGEEKGLRGGRGKPRCKGGRRGGGIRGKVQAEIHLG